MQALIQVRRSYSIGLAAFCLALPFLILTIDTSDAAPKSARDTNNTNESTTPAADLQKPADPPETRRRRNVKLNYISASWTKVLQDFAEATQTELVADRVPGRAFSRWDMKFYTRDEALAILNQELQPLKFRLQFKGNYLVLNALQEFRREYPAAVLRGTVPEQAEAADEGTAADGDEHGGEPAKPAVRAAAYEETRPKPSAKEPPAQRKKGIQRVSGDEMVRPVQELKTAPASREPAVTMVRIRERDVVSVSKIIYKAFKPQAELIDDGPHGWQGFLVRQAGGEKERDQAGESAVRFAIGIDEAKNRLAIEATPAETKGVLRLVEAVDKAPVNRQSTVRAVATTKNAAKMAAALQPELNRLSKATRRLAQKDAERNAEAAQEAAAEDAPRTEQRVLPLRPGTRRGEAAGPADGGAASVPRALSKSIRGDVKVESIPDLGVLVLTGNEADVQAVMEVIQEIERLSAGTAPEVQVAFLRHVSSEALAQLLSSVYERLGQVRNATVQQSQAITVFPVSRPNAILIVASKADMPDVFKLIDEIDVDSDPSSEFRVYRLKYAVPGQVVDEVEKLYPPQQPAQGAQAQGLVGLVPRVRIIEDLRTNSVIVQARPRDLREVTDLIAQLDVNDSESEQLLRIFRLEYAVAEEVSATVSQAIQAVLAPSRATTVQQQAAGGGPGGPGQGQGGGAAAAQGASELKEIKSAILKFRDKEGPDGRELRSGILADIRMTPDFRTNTITVTAPEESMELVAAFIKKLDVPPNAVAEIKIFKLTNSDATAMQNLLSTLFGVQRAGQQGQAGGGQGGAQAGVPGLLVADAEDSSSMLIPLRFSVDVRTNSITAIGGAAALNVVESVLLTLDESNIRQRQNEVYRLKNVPAATVAQAISQFLQTQRQVLTADQGITSPFEQIEREVIVVPEAVSNSLLISATPRYFEDIKMLILQLDQVPKQVLIEALFIEVQLDNVDEFGMEFGVQDSVLFRRSYLANAPQFITSTTLTPAGTVSSQSILSESATPGFNFNGQQLGNNTSPNINQSSVAGQLGTGFATALTNSTLGYPGLLLQAGSQNLNLLLRALSFRNRVDILSRPLVRTVDNQTANIQVGQQVPIINGFTTNATTGVNSPNVQQRQIGIILQVTPRITPDGLVVMEVVARKDSLASTGIPLVTSATGTVTSPIINTQNALTTIAVPTGQTVVLGGMITKNDTVQERKVPMLGDIPILGNAFRYDFKETTRTELIIFLTPRIIHNNEEAEMFKEIEIGRLNFIESNAEQVYGPLHSVPAMEIGKPEPQYGFPLPVKPKEPKEPAGTKRKLPPPPQPSLPLPPPDDSQDLIPMPASDDDIGLGTTLNYNDDDEDLDAAFIQTKYQAPAGNRSQAGRVRVGSSTTKPPSAKAKRKPPAHAQKTAPLSGDERPTRARVANRDDS